ERTRATCGQVRFTDSRSSQRERPKSRGKDFGLTFAETAPRSGRTGRLVAARSWAVAGRGDRRDVHKAVGHSPLHGGIAEPRTMVNVMPSASQSFQVMRFIATPSVWLTPNPL